MRDLDLPLSAGLCHRYHAAFCALVEHGAGNGNLPRHVSLHRDASAVGGLNVHAMLLRLSLTRLKVH